MIEWLEYVLLNAIFPGPSDVCAFVTRSFVLNPAFELADRNCRDGAPRDDAEESVSSEFVPCSECDSGIGGTAFPGESSPFFVVAFECARPPSAKRPFALGADATRRMNRDAFAPIALGESGPERDGVVGVGGMKESCEELAVAVWGALRPSMRCLSERFLDRCFSELADGSTSDDGACWK